MERRDEVVNDPETGEVREQHVTRDPAAGPPAAPPVADSTSEFVSTFNPARRGVELIYLIFGVIVGLLLIRVVLKILGANPLAPFTTFIYNVTAFFLAPFRNLLPTVGNSQSQFEVSVIVAILVYLLIAWVLARLIMVLFARNVSVSRSRRSGLRPRGY